MRFKLPIWVRSLLKATKFWQENKLVLQQLKYLRWLAFSTIIISLVGATLEGLTVGLIASFLQGFTNPSEPPIQTGIEWFDTLFLATKASAQARIYRLSALILLAIWLRSLFRYLGQFYSQVISLKLGNRLRQAIFEQLQSVSLKYYATTRAGALVSSVKSEVNQIQKAFNLMAILITQGSTLLAYIVSMLLLSWQLSFGVVMIFSLMSVGLSNITARVREASFALPTANKRFTSVSLEFINGIRTVHASASQDFERQRFYKAAEQILDAGSKIARLSALVQPLVKGISSTMLILIVVVAFNLFVSSGQLKAASLLTFLFALSRTTPLVSRINKARADVNSFQGALDNVNQLLRRDDKPYIKDGKIEFTRLKTAIEFASVDFGYSREELVLKNITLSIEKGKTTALVGSSGAGKTTLADLLPRFHDPTYGQILIDGIDLRALKINSLRNKMAIVSQDTFIFNASVSYNIAYGFDTFDEDKIREVAQQANALEFIQELPEGLDTQLGDRGVRLSGGQRQRIAIARALLRNPEILILDEATSALDSVTERLIQESLERLSTGRTVIAIAHRLSTIMRADKVIVLDEGQILEQGTYQELLEKQGKLWEFHQMQHDLAS